VPAYPVLRRLGEIAEEQWGLVTRRQAEAAGISRATIARLSATDPGPAGLERVASGVYRLRGAPQPDHVDLRAAWLRLAPGVLAWQRAAEQGVVSHRSAASLFGLGHLPADRHEFSLATRRQSRRPDVRLHLRALGETEWVELSGLPVTRPSRTAADLLSDGEDPGAVAQVIADATREGLDRPGAFADSLAPYAARFGLRRGDGVGLLAWGRGQGRGAPAPPAREEPDAPRWLQQARGRGIDLSLPATAARAAVPSRIAHRTMA
jgi:predicted transcriptional regulator of viral defense system